MQTGYDNYWMYHNRRHELVLCYPKNDFSHPVFTDNYKQVQGMGNPGNLCNRVPCPNTVARPHQKVPNDQHRVSGTESMWPSSVCLPPYSSSLTHNFLPREACPVQSNNMYDSSKSQQNQVLRNVENCNLNNYPGQIVNNKVSSGPVIAQNSYNYKAQSARIRVKDISLLNNNNNNNNNSNNKNNNYGSLLDSGLHQAQQKRQHYYSYDCTTVTHNRICDDQTQKNCTNYGSTAISELNHPYQNYGHRFNLNTEEQYSQPSSFYQQSAQFTYERQLCYDNVQQRLEKSSEAFNRGNYPPPLTKSHNQSVIQEPTRHTAQLNPAVGRSDNSAYAKTSNAFNRSGLAESSGEMSTTSRTRPPLPENSQPSLLNPITSANEPRTEPTANARLLNTLGGRKIGIFTVANPSTAENIIRVNDSISSDPNRNQNLRLPSTNSGSFVRNEIDTQREAVGTGERNAVSFSGSENTWSRVPRLFDQQEPVAGCAMNKEDRSHHPNDIGSGISKQPSRRETVVVCQSKKAVNCPAKPKVETPEAGKDGFEKGNAVHTIQTAKKGTVQTIKSEIGIFAQNGNGDQPSDSYFLEEIKPCDVENGENIDSFMVKTPESKCQTPSADLNHTEEPEVTVLEETGSIVEESITVEDTVQVEEVGNQRVTSVIGGCKSEINRDKLDLLIEFLKKDGESVETTVLTESGSPSPSTPPQSEKGRKENRRKLSKTCVIKNKNTEREMVSLVSYKPPKQSPKSASAKKSPDESEENETRNSCGESGSAEECEYLGSSPESISNGKSPEGSDDSSDGKRHSKSTSAQGEAAKEPTENSSLDGKGITTEERKVISIMRAFQNLKSHFCASCDLTSSVESIWINVVSGEVRCLNCFKKMMLKGEENVSKSKKCSVDGVDAVKASRVHNDAVGDGRRNKEEKNKKCEGRTLSTKQAYKSEDLKEHVKEEEVRPRFENSSGDAKKEDAVTANRNSGKEQCEQSSKRQVSDEKVEPEVKIRRESSEKRRTNSSEEHASEKHRKKGDEQALDSWDKGRKRINSAEEWVPRKVQILEESAEGEKQNKTVWREKCSQKSLATEGSGSQRNTTFEEALAKNRKHETHGRPKVLHSTEGGSTEHKSYKTEQSKVKEGRTEHESKRKGDETSEKPKIKRTISDEKVEVKKMRTAEEYNKGKSQQVGHSLEKSKMRVESKEDSEKNKTAAGKGAEEAEEKVDWTGKGRKSTESKEGSHIQGRYEEDLNKAAQMFGLLGTYKKKSSPTQRRRRRGEALDPTYSPTRTVTKPVRKLKKKTEEDASQKSHLAKKTTIKKERCSRTKDETAQPEQKGKHCVEKAWENSDSERTDSGNSTPDMPIDKQYRKSKQCLISKLFKGKPNTRVNPRSKVKETEAHKRKDPRIECRRHEEERRNETSTEENRRRSQTHPKSSARAVETSSDKRKHPAEDPTDGKSSQNRNWDGPNGRKIVPKETSPSREKKDKSVGCVFGEIMKDMGDNPKSKSYGGEVTYPTNLLAQLMKKTKKLSWSLLGET